MSSLRTIAARLVVLLVVSALAWACTPSSTEPESITGSGTIEAQTVALTSEQGGRVQDVRADEGDAVEQGAVLMRFDTALIDAQIGEAEAGVLAAEAQLEGVKASAHPEEIRAAEAKLAQARAQRDGAKRAWENAQAVVDNPQELHQRIDEARTRVALAEIRVEQAEAVLHAAQVRRDGYPNPSAEYYIAQQQVAAAQASLEQARTQHAGAQQVLENLLDMRENPIQMQAEVHSARSQYQQAESAVEAVQAELDLLKAGPTAEEVAAAEANLKQARAALEALRVQREKMALTSPVDGLVVSRAIQPGEIASPGATLLRLADLDRVKLTVYVPETQIANVQLGQSVNISVDAYPNRTFEGEVTFIAQEAEFTPRNVQTEDQRANLVFAVTISLDNPDHLLKPGMPADATLTVD